MAERRDTVDAFQPAASHLHLYCSCAEGNYNHGCPLHGTGIYAYLWDAHPTPCMADDLEEFG